MSEKRQSRRARVLSSLYDYSTTIADKRPGSNRAIAAETAATILSMSLELMDKKNLTDLFFTEADAAAVDSMALSAKEHEKLKEPTHFMDRFIERLVKHTVSDDAEDVEELTNRITDPSRSRRPPLLIRILTSNMKRLSIKMSAFFKLQYGAIHVITWRKPTKTLSVLVLYTAVCMWPHLVLAFPLLVVVFGIIVPAYLYRHPRDMPELMHVRRRGQSLLEFLNQSDDHSVLMDILEDVDEDLNLSITTDSRKSWATEGTDKYDVADEPVKKDKAKFVRSQVSMLMNMRDLQNLTTDVLNSIDQVETLATEILGFKDERLTTFLFYIVLLTTFVVLFLGRYIPWRMIFIQAGWGFMILCHPHTKKYLVAILQRKAKRPRQESMVDTLAVPSGSQGIMKQDNTPVPAAKKSILENFDRNDIIVDDHPQVRIVEIYELQRRNVLKQEWVFFAYTKRLFHAHDPVRVAGKLPHGVDSLGKVLPPPDWKYDFGYASNWRIDLEPDNFLCARGIKNMKCDKDGWIHDTEDTPDTEFRRRRLYRECYRYARLPRKVVV